MVANFVVALWLLCSGPFATRNKKLLNYAIHVFVFLLIAAVKIWDVEYFRPICENVSHIFTDASAINYSEKHMYQLDGGPGALCICN
jgi:hypothetical protein